MAAPAIDHSARLMTALQAKGTPVFSLTNFGIQSYDFAATHYPFMRAFDRDFISGHMQVTKPDARKFMPNAGGRQADCPSGDALLFADDRQRQYRCSTVHSAGVPTCSKDPRGGLTVWWPKGC